jgi:hypothetical protein
VAYSQAHIEDRLSKMARKAKTIQETAEALNIAGNLPDVDPSSMPINLTAPPPSPLTENKR